MNSETTFRLAESTAVEPLVNSWFAWSNAISPLPASLHLTHYQLPLMESYLSEPAIHIEARKNPRFMGGPFIDIPVENKDRIRALLEKTKSDLSTSVNWANEIFQLSNRLVKEAQGQSLEPFYRSLPSSLRGCVELVYDYHHRPSVRFIEALLYKTEHYRPDLQSFRLYRVGSDDARPFFLNTPRVEGNGGIDWPVHFEDTRVDEFFSLALIPKRLGYIRELLGTPIEIDDQRLKSFFTERPRKPCERWDESRVRYRYFGHACVLLQYKGASILVDPFIALRPAGDGEERFSYDDLPDRIDYLLVTHNHLDHFNPEILLRLRSQIGAIVVPGSLGALYGDMSLKLLLQKIGFRHVIEVDSFDTIDIPGGEIIAIPFLGEHSDLLHAKTAYVVRTGSRQTLLAADSDCLDKEIYVNVKKHLGRIDTLFLGMECEGAPVSYGYGSLFPQKIRRDHDETRRQRGCNAVRGWDIASSLGANRVYNYAMGLEPWTRYILGLSLGDKSPQWQESEKLVRRIQQTNGAIAKRLYSKDEVIVSDKPDDRFSTVPVPADIVQRITRADRHAFRAQAAELPR